MEGIEGPWTVPLITIKLERAPPAHSIVFDSVLRFWYLLIVKFIIKFGINKVRLLVVKVLGPHITSEL